MTPEQALQALLAARAQLPPALALRELGVMATAFSATGTSPALEPELVVFHGHEGTLAPAVASAVAAAGVQLRYEQHRELSTAGVPPEQRKFADEVLTQAGTLMGSARLFVNPQKNRKATLGCIATVGGVRGFITCRHVVAEALDGQLFWPGKTDVIAKSDKAVPPVHEIGLNAAYGPDFPVRPLRVDAAFVPLAHFAPPSVSQVHGVGPVQPPVATPRPDLSMVGRIVCATGAASGKRRGRIAGLLYEEYLPGFLATADYLIASADDACLPMSNAGDSGSVWFLENTRQPLALNFGRQLLSSGPLQHPLALASNLDLALARLGATIA
jgi:hypothetical protein